jgi:hypothetical protein
MWLSCLHPSLMSCEGENKTNDHALKAGAEAIGAKYYPGTVHGRAKWYKLFSEASEWFCLEEFAWNQSNNKRCSCRFSIV